MKTCATVISMVSVEHRHWQSLKPSVKVSPYTVIPLSFLTTLVGISVQNHHIWYTLRLWALRNDKAFFCLMAVRIQYFVNLPSTQLGFGMIEMAVTLLFLSFRAQDCSKLSEFELHAGRMSCALQCVGQLTDFRSLIWL